MSRRVTAFLVAVLLAGVLLSFLIFTRQQAQVVRRDTELFQQVNALMYALTASRDPEESRRLALDAQARLFAELQRKRIPVVLTDTLGTPSTVAFLPRRVLGGRRGPETPEDFERIRAYAEELDRERPHLAFPEVNLLVHFGDPPVLRRLRWIPWLQASALLAIVGGGAWLIFTSFRSERERIWSAMARESAHQMGTPLSSLVGWLEVLEARATPDITRPGEPDLIDEMADDVRRLQKVSRRFELIGRKPQLEPVPLREVLIQLRRYFEARLPSLRASSTIEIRVDVAADAPEVLGNATLLEWAFENLMKNAIDAMASEGGRITISYLGPNGRRAVFLVRDTGPGVAASVRDRIFDIGVTTKERGWGVGLSLTRRIIEDMHDGAIYLEDTSTGASFRVELPVPSPGVK